MHFEGVVVSLSAAPDSPCGSGREDEAGIGVLCLWRERVKSVGTVEILGNEH